MNLIVLAAGRGRRMARISAEAPKCLAELGDRTTVLGRTTAAANAVDGIEEMVVVAGYKAEEIEAALGRMDVPIRTRVVYNPFYARAGPLVSIWLALPWMEEHDFLLCNGDTTYSARAMAQLVQREDGIALAVEPASPRRRPDAVRVIRDGAGGVGRVGKDIRPKDAYGVSMGLLAVRGPTARRAFVETVARMVRSPENLRRRMIWHGVINQLVEQGLGIGIVDLDPVDWHEIDTAEDLRRTPGHPVDP